MVNAEERSQMFHTPMLENTRCSAMSWPTDTIWLVLVIVFVCADPVLKHWSFYSVTTLSLKAEVVTGVRLGAVTGAPHWRETES